ncbi:MAG: ferrochelatase [Anaplasma sp.]
MARKVAVVLLNLGGPGSLDEVEEFLFSLFSDRYVIRLPQPLRALVAMLISKLRARSAREIYALMGGKSTILEETERQASALEKRLSNDVDTCYRVFTCMRHAEPKSGTVLNMVHDYQPEKVVLLPLYPQYSSTTTLSAIQDWYDGARRAHYKFNTDVVCCYHSHADFIASHCKLLLHEYSKALVVHANPRVLFSAHGLPVHIVEEGDPYQQHVQQTVRLIVEGLGMPNLDYLICYQSKVGHVRWLEPSTKSAILQAQDDGVPVVVVPISFVSEHSETLVELDIEYAALMKQKGWYFRVPALGTDELFISCLDSLSRKTDRAAHPCDNRHKFCWRHQSTAMHP